MALLECLLLVFPIAKPRIFTITPIFGTFFPRLSLPFSWQRQFATFFMCLLCYQDPKIRIILKLYYFLNNVEKLECICIFWVKKHYDLHWFFLTIIHFSKKGTVNQLVWSQFQCRNSYLYLLVKELPSLLYF